MSGKRLVRHTTEELRAMEDRGESKTEWRRLSREEELGIEPDLSGEDECDWDGSTVRDASGEIIGAIRGGHFVPRRRGPGKKPPKVSTTLRLDPDVVAEFRAGGRGWQSRMNEALREWLKTHR
jgi:uncharacterized protein (DUF4415 family)